MEKKIAIIGHAEQGIRDLQAVENILEASAHKKTINEMIEEKETLRITAPEIALTPFNPKTGKENRRERRAQERKAKKLPKQ